MLWVVSPSLFWWDFHMWMAMVRIKGWISSSGVFQKAHKFGQNDEATKLVNLNVDVCVASDLRFFFPIKLMPLTSTSVRSWYPYWWWLRSFVHEGHSHTCCLSSIGRQPVANELQDVWWAVGACGECTVYRGCTLHCCYRHRTMAATPEDIRREASSLPHVLIL